VGPAVPAPYNFYGEIRSNDDPPPDTGNLLSWDYDNEDDIRGFRIYRNDGSGFDQLVDEDELDNEDRDYFDADDEECMSYYVVAVYLNDSGSLQESNASNQWTSSCP
jgi:hypothetical protein